MFSEIIKIIMCSSLLIGIYFGFFQNERMFRFNRWYLIFALVFSYAIPFCTIKVNLPTNTNGGRILIEEAIQTSSLVQKTPSIFTLENVVLMIYVSITLLFLVKALLSITKILRLKGEKILYKGVQTKICYRHIAPFSFGTTLYIGRRYFENNEIDAAIFVHEKCHIEQKHVLDLFFIELLIVFSWFNPALYFYKKAILNNHEFLADEKVLKSNYSLKTYQNLVLNEIENFQTRYLSNQFNFNNTKKRFIMMTSEKSKFVKIKKIVMIPVFVGLSLAFIQKVYAHEPILNNELSKELILPNSENNYLHRSEIQNSSKNLQLSKETENENAMQSDTIKKSKSEYAPLKAESRWVENSDQSSDHFTQVEFANGINALRNAIHVEFNSSIFSGKEKGPFKTVAFLHVSKEGKLEKVTSEGDSPVFNDEVKRCVEKVMQSTELKPASRNGIAEASVYKLPVTMSFE